MNSKINNFSNISRNAFDIVMRFCQNFVKIISNKTFNFEHTNNIIVKIFVKIFLLSLKSFLDGSLRQL